MELNYKNVIQELLEKLPEFHDSEEFKYFEDEANLPTIIFGAFRQFYIKTYQEGDKELIKRMSNFLEKIAKIETKEMKELICFGFLENISPKANYYDGLVGTFGEVTLKRLQETNEYWKKLQEIHEKSRNNK